MEPSSCGLNLISISLPALPVSQLDISTLSFLRLKTLSKRHYGPTPADATQDLISPHTTTKPSNKMITMIIYTPPVHPTTQPPSHTLPSLSVSSILLCKTHPTNPNTQPPNLQSLSPNPEYPTPPPNHPRSPLPPHPNSPTNLTPFTSAKATVSPLRSVKWSKLSSLSFVDITLKTPMTMISRCIKRLGSAGIEGCQRWLRRRWRRRRGS